MSLAFPKFLSKGRRFHLRFFLVFCYFLFIQIEPALAENPKIFRHWIISGDTKNVSTYLTGPRKFIISRRTTSGAYFLIRFWIGGDAWLCRLKFKSDGYDQTKCRAIFWRLSQKKGKRVILGIGPELAPYQNILLVSQAWQPAPTEKNSGVSFCLTSNKRPGAWAFFSRSAESYYDSSYAPSFGSEACPGLWFTEIPL